MITLHITKTQLLLGSAFLLIASAITIYDYVTETTIPADYTEIPLNQKNSETSFTPEKNDYKDVKKVLVQLSGEVMTPGIYAVTENSRVLDAIQLAGGPTAKANLHKVNMVSKIKDGKRIYVPPMTSKSASKNPALTTQLNINTATQAQWEKLPHIGPSTAKKIIKYRQENGPFASLSELTEVQGIGTKTLKKLTPYLTF